MKLKPCPFCGGEARIELEHGTFEGYDIKKVYCSKCSASASVEEWNHRIGEGK